MFGDADLRTFFADFGVPVGFQGATKYSDGTPILGIFDRPVQIKGADQGFGGAETAFPAVRLPYNAFRPAPGTGDAVNVDGTDYTVAERTTQEDGAVLCLELKAVVKAGPR